MAEIDDIAKNLTCSRLEFSGIFLRAQDNLDIAVLDRNDFEAIVQSADITTAFKEALAFSKRVSGLYTETLRLLVRDGFYPKAALSLLDPDTKAVLEATTNEARGYGNPMELGYGYIASTRWTGKVMINGTAKGSGVLIGPRRFLTAWHVVEDMFEPLPIKDIPVPDANGGAQITPVILPSTYKPKDNPPSLQIVFDDYIMKVEGRRIPPRPSFVEADIDFCEVYCECHIDELNKKIPNPTTNLEGYWDYAVITLAKPMDVDRSYARVEANAVVPDDNANIILLQYPNGSVLKTDTDKIVSPTPADKAIPEFRFLHLSNAEHGSSGGPVFDKDFFLVGLHQGKWPVQLNEQVTNRGVPIRRIKRDMDGRSKLPMASGPKPGRSPDDGMLWFTDQKSYDPIIGLDDFQLLVRNSIDAYLERNPAASSSGTIWLIQGDPGSGKSYCIDALFPMLANTSHLKIKLPGEKIAKMDAVKLAKFICSEAGTSLKGLESFKKYNTTKAAWLRDEVTQKLLRQLEDQRSKRMVWICINNLNIYDITGRNTADFLLYLYECVLQNPWLQIVLDGLKIDLPSTLSAATKVYATHPKTREEIKQYVQRFLMSGPFEKPSPDMLEKFADKLFKPYQQQLQAKSKEPMKFLYLQTTALLFQFMEKLRKKEA